MTYWLCWKLEEVKNWLVEKSEGRLEGWMLKVLVFWGVEKVWAIEKVWGCLVNWGLGWVLGWMGNCWFRTEYLWKLG